MWPEAAADILAIDSINKALLIHTENMAHKPLIIWDSSYAQQLFFFFFNNPTKPKLSFLHGRLDTPAPKTQSSLYMTPPICVSQGSSKENVILKINAGIKNWS